MQIKQFELYSKNRTTLDKILIRQHVKVYDLLKSFRSNFRKITKSVNSIISRFGNLLHARPVLSEHLQAKVPEGNRLMQLCRGDFFLLF